MAQFTSPVRPELVEGLSFFSIFEKKGQGFDKLSPNGLRFEELAHG